MTKKVFVTGLVIFMLVFLVSCNKKEDIEVGSEISVTEPAIETEAEPAVEEEPVVEEETDTEPGVEEVVDPYEGMAISPLTGLYVDEEVISRRPFGISISNIKTALPQSGIGQAEIIYETLAEGGIPRLLAVFQEFGVDKIGPIRSARHYYLDFCYDFDAVYTHYGKSPQAQSAFYNQGAEHMDGMSDLDNIICYQAEDRSRPHATYTNYDMLMEGMEIRGYSEEYDTEMDSKLKFSEEPFDLESENVANNVYLHFSYYHDPWFEYNEDEMTYYRFQYDEAHIDDVTGEQLRFENIIVQSTNMWVISGDTEGRLDMALVSDGSGYYITHGEYIEITWEKTSHDSPTHYYDMDGNEIVLNPGKTWISVLPSYNFDEVVFE